MSIARFSVTRPVAVTMRIASMTLLGFVCVLRLPIDLLPKVTIPTISVSTTWPNVAPEEMETQITRKVEQAVSSAPNVNIVTSSTTTGQSSVRIQFNWGTDVGQAAVDVLQLVQRAKQQFPNDPKLQSPIVFKFDPSSLPIRIYGVSGSMDSVKLRTILDNEVTPLIESADGVAAAVATGGQQRAIMVDVDPHRLQAYHLSMDDVSQRLQDENINIPGGIAKQGNTELVIRSVGDFVNPQDAMRVPLTSVNGQVVTLADVAVVRDAFPEVRIYTRLNGQPAAGVIITKQSASNTVEVAKNIDEKLKQINQEYPQIKFGLAYDQAGFIENSISDLKVSAMIGGMLAITILMLFLRNVRSTIVVGLSIPVSIISTFALLYFGGFTLNTISLSGLALATGLIVDDAVVVLENIFRHIERDKRPAAEAAVTGTNEIMGAVIASTLTIMIVFLPLLLIKGQSGQTFTQFALVVMFSIAVSLLDAVTVVPMLASRLIREKEVHEEAHPELRDQTKKPSPLIRVFDWFGMRFNAVDEAYHHGLKWALRHRFLVLGVAGGVTLLSFLIVPFIGSEMLPQTDSGDFTVNIKLPIGSALATTDAKVREVEKILMANKDVQTVFSAAGTTLSLRGSTTAQINNQGSATVKLKANRSKPTQQVIKDLQAQLARIPGVRILVTPYDLVTQILTGGATNMEVDLFGSSLPDLTQQSKLVSDKLRAVPGLESVDVGVQDASPEIQWHIDRAKAQQLGVSFTDVANALNASTNGTLSSYYEDEGIQVPIYVQVREDLRKSVDQLLALPIQTKIKVANGDAAPTVRLGDIATPSVGTGPNEITRINRQRYIAVTGRVAGRSEGDVQADIGTAMKQTALPAGMRWDFGVNQKRRADEFSGMGAAVLLAVALIYMLLASQFESFIYPLVVLTSVPLCAIGVVLALFLSGRAFGLTAFIGLLMLVGIVVKNGILLVDYTNQLRGRGMPREEAVLTAGPTRLRPILMTTCAATLGMLPLALALGRGQETQAPLATAVIGGLITSTLLTLFVVPVVYTLFDDLVRKAKKEPLDLAASQYVEPSVAAVGPVLVGDDQPGGKT